MAKDEPGIEDEVNIIMHIRRYISYNQIPFYCCIPIFFVVAVLPYILLSRGIVAPPPNSYTMRMRYLRSDTLTMPVDAEMYLRRRTDCLAQVGLFASIRVLCRHYQGRYVQKRRSYG